MSHNVRAITKQVGCYTKQNSTQFNTFSRLSQLTTITKSVCGHIKHGFRWTHPGDFPQSFAPSNFLPGDLPSDLESLLEWMKRLDFSKSVTRRLTPGSNDYTNPTRPSWHVTWTGGKSPGVVHLLRSCHGLHDHLYQNVAPAPAKLLCCTVQTGWTFWGAELVPPMKND